MIRESNFMEPHNKNSSKTCAIVGNAESLFNKKNGHLIDACDIVVRINTVEIRSPACQGTRTDFLFSHTRRLKRLHLPESTPFKIINISTDLSKDFGYWSRKIKNDIPGCKKARPTTGFIAIMHMYNKGYTIKLFGFDWYQTKTYYNKTNKSWKRHFPKWEKNKINEIL